MPWKNPWKSFHAYQVITNSTGVSTLQLQSIGFSTLNLFLALRRLWLCNAKKITLRKVIYIMEA